MKICRYCVFTKNIGMLTSCNVKICPTRNIIANILYLDALFYK